MSSANASRAEKAVNGGTPVVRTLPPPASAARQAPTLSTAPLALREDQGLTTGEISTLLRRRGFGINTEASVTARSPRPVNRRIHTKLVTPLTARYGTIG